MKLLLYATLLLVIFTVCPKYSIADEVTQTVSLNEEFTDYLPTPASSSTRNYLFNLPDDGKLKLHFRHDHLSLGLDTWFVTIWDATGTNQFLSATSKTSDREMFERDVGLPQGDYMVRVEGVYIGSIVNYYITLEFTAETNIEQELNDSIPSATSVTSYGQDYTGYLQGRSADQPLDIDYYHFNLSDSENIDFYFTHKTLAAGSERWDIAILDATGTNEFLSERSWVQTNKEFTRNIGLPKGDYLVLVSSDIITNDRVYPVDYTFRININDNILNPVWLESAQGSFTQIQSAYFMAPTGPGATDTIKVKVEEMGYEDLVFDQDVVIRLAGGYDDTFSNVIGDTSFYGTLTISGGPVTISNLIIK